MGSHKGKGRSNGIRQVTKAIDYALSHGPKDSDVSIILENTAGHKNSVGDTFEDLAEVLDSIQRPDRLGICFDTCHGFAAGYDLRTSKAVNTTFKALDKALGLRSLKVLHLNDSKNEYGSHRDLHAHIGQGHIGKAGFRAILNHPKLKTMPMILETPNNAYGNMETNLSILRQLMGKQP